MSLTIAVGFSERNKPYEDTLQSHAHGGRHVLVGIIGDKLMYSPVPFLLPYSVDQKTIETTVESSKLDTTDPSGEKIRYKLVNISLEILGE